jgi:hypothetical protein
MVWCCRRVILHFVLFLIPISVYGIGNGLGIGVRWIFFRYQETAIGANLTNILQDASYIGAGVIQEQSAVSYLLWVAGATLLVVSLLNLLNDIDRKKETRRRSGILVATAGIVLLLSMMAEYGVTLQGPAGFEIPFSLPLVWLVAWWVYQTHEGDPVEPDEARRIPSRPVARKR